MECQLGRGGRAKDRQEPERKCIATGAVHPKWGLLRFVVDPDGRVVPDVLEKLPGRGIWVSADRDAIERAAAKGLFARSARRSVMVPDALSDDIEAALIRRVVELLSMARKAGKAVAGYEKVKAMLARDEAVLLLQASDGSKRGKSKLRPPEGKDSVFGVLNAAELGLAFGREHVIHAALAAGGLTEKLRKDVLRLSGVRKSVGGDAAGKVKNTR